MKIFSSFPPSFVLSSGGLAYSGSVGGACINNFSFLEKLYVVCAREAYFVLLFFHFIFEKSSISASKIPVTPICHGTLSRNFFERFDFVTKKNRFRDKPIFSLTHKIQFSDK